LARDNPPRPSAARLSVQPEWRQLFGFPRTYLARKAPGPVNRNRQAGRYPLKIAAKVDAAYLAYFKTSIEPLLDHPLVEFIGEIGETQKQEFSAMRVRCCSNRLAGAFGLVMIEAMSAGTRDHLAQRVRAGWRQRQIVDSIEAAVVAVQQAVQMDRRAVRASSNSVSPPTDGQGLYSRLIVSSWRAFGKSEDFCAGAACRGPNSAAVLGTAGWECEAPA